MTCIVSRILINLSDIFQADIKRKIQRNHVSPCEYEYFFLKRNQEKVVFIADGEEGLLH